MTTPDLDFFRREGWYAWHAFAWWSTALNAACCWYIGEGWKLAEEVPGYLHPYAENTSCY